MKRTISLLASGLVCLSMLAQGTVADYKRASNLRQQFAGKADIQTVTHRFLQGDGLDNNLLYTLQSKKGTEYFLVDLKKNVRKPLFDAEKLAKALSDKTGQTVNPYDMHNSNTEVRMEGGKLVVTFQHSNSHWTYSPDSNTLTKGEETRQPGQNRPQWGEGGGRQRHWAEVDMQRDRRVIRSQDGKTEIWVQDNNLQMRNTATNEDFQLTTDGSDKSYYSSWGSFSSDGKYYVTNRINPGVKRYVTYVNSSPTDQLQPKYFNIEYAKPGDTLNHEVPVVVEVATRKVTVLDDALFKEQYEVSTPRWDRDQHTFTFSFNERGHKTYRILEYNADNGQLRPIIEEKEEKYIAWTRLHRRDVNEGKQIIWFSERDRYGHLYLYDRATAKVINQITKGKFYVRQILHIDEEKKQIWFTANGEGLPKTNPNEDPYNIHYCRVGFNGKGFIDLTPEEGSHSVQFSPDRSYLIDTYSTVEVPPVTVLRDGKTGKIMQTLATSDISELQKTNWQKQEVFVAKARDGKTDIWGIIQRPTNFDPTKKYPVIEYIYSGPGDQYVPKTFSTIGGQASLAELGFIVVQMDGMSTSWRSKDFEEVCYKNLKDAGFEDRKLWIKAAAEKYPYMDIDRVGIYGCSAGGQEALAALLFHGDFYKAAYSACGCHDNRMDKIWWNEQWMGYPIDDSYIASSNTENIDKLKGKLMLVVGELDDNVDPSSTFQVVNQLIKHNKDFEFIYLPGERHTMGGAYGDHKMRDFFVKNLLGVTPPEWDALK